MVSFLTIYWYWIKALFKNGIMCSGHVTKEGCVDIKKIKKPRVCGPPHTPFHAHLHSLKSP